MGIKEEILGSIPSRPTNPSEARPCGLMDNASLFKILCSIPIMGASLKPALDFSEIFCYCSPFLVPVANRCNDAHEQFYIKFGEGLWQFEESMIRNKSDY